jgi:hypothetical protein
MKHEVTEGFGWYAERKKERKQIVPFFFLIDLLAVPLF